VSDFEEKDNHVDPSRLIDLIPFEKPSPINEITERLLRLEQYIK